MEARKIAYFENPRFINRAFEPQLCAFRDRETVSTLEARSRSLIDEAFADCCGQLASVPGSEASLRDGPVHVGLLMPEIDERTGGCGAIV